MEADFIINVCESKIRKDVVNNCLTRLWVLLVLKIGLRAGNRSSFADTCCTLWSQHYRSSVVLLVEMKEMTKCVSIHLAAVGGLPYFFHLCCSFRMLTLGMMPISLQSTLIINNPLELCSFYRNNRGACLTNLYSNPDSSVVHLIISARCALIGQRCEEQLKMQRSQLECFCGFQLHKSDKLLLGASTLHHSSVCLRVWLGWWLCFPAHRSLFDQLNQDVFVLCLSVSTVWVWKYFESSWYPIREGPNMTSN